MRIAVDVDGVLCNFIEPFLKHIEKKYNLSNLKEIAWLTWDMKIDGIDILTEIKELCKDRDWILGLPMIENAKTGMYALKDFNHNVFVATARDETCVEATLDWLLYSLPYMPTVYFTKFYEKTVDRLNVDVLIDDRPKNCLDFVNSGGNHAFLFNHFYNRDGLKTKNIIECRNNPKITRVYSWMQIIVIFKVFSLKR